MDEDQQAPHVPSREGTNRAVSSEGARQNMKLERLEVEDEDARVTRLQSIFEKLNSTTSSSGFVGNALGMSNVQFDFGERKTWAVEPPSELISRVQAFLPQMEASNVILTQRVEADPQSIDMEHIEDDAAQYIEMNLGLGVFDMKPKRQSGDEDTEMIDSSSASSSSSDSDSGSDSESDSDLDSEEILSSFIPSSLLSRSPPSFDSISSDGEKKKAPRMICPLPKRTRSSATQSRPNIVVLSEHDL